MLLSLCYLVVRGILQLATLRCCSDDFTALEIIVLRHELDILRRRTRRPVMTTVDRLFLAAASRLSFAKTVAGRRRCIPSRRCDEHDSP